MIGKLLAIGLLSATTICSPIYNESTELPPAETETETETGTETGTETEYLCYVTFDVSKGGDVYTDITEGNVGDIVTLYVGENMFYDLSLITLNGVNLVAGEDGNYTFSLVEGENKVKVEFAINNEEVSAVLETLDKAKQGDWDSIFNVENLFTFLSWLFNFFVGSGLCLTLLKNKKIKSKTAQEISDAVQQIAQSSVAEAINKFLQETMGPSLDTISSKLDTTSETAKVLARCFILSQENTPESRLAIIQELTNLKTNEQELSEKIKTIINLQISENNKLQEQKQKDLESLKEANENIQLVNTDDTDIKGSY